ncbi:hypothetical protein [Microbacterium sp. PMB16]|uniref:hypothetical protein n=1 Tax=Microbacterium sp. PMB16 TaxID=3120157 RepID=UPI003F4C285C
MSLSRAHRQVEEFALLLEERFDAVGPRRAEREAAKIDVDWGVPILAGVWSQSLSSVHSPLVRYRPGLKRALIALRQRERGGAGRSQRDLLALVAACEDEYAEEMESMVPELDSGRPGSYGALVATGTRLQLAPDATRLAETLAIPRLARLANGADPARLLPDMSRLRLVPQSIEYARLWRGLYLRLASVLWLQRFGDAAAAPDAIVFVPEHFYTQFHELPGGGATGVESASLVFDSAEIRSLLSTAALDGKSGSNDIQITGFPLHPISGGYVTSLHLILDSIAPWAQTTIHELDLWMSAISEPFETWVLGALEEHGFVAGNVNESGHWDLGRGEGVTRTSAAANEIRRTLSGATGSPGEIDVLAWHEEHELLIMVECKSINAIGNLQTVSTTLSPADAAGWRRKLRKKVEWVERVSGMHVGLSIIALEGVVFHMSYGIDDTPILDAESLTIALDSMF